MHLSRSVIKVDAEIWLIQDMNTSINVRMTIVVDFEMFEISIKSFQFRIAVVYNQWLQL